MEWGEEEVIPRGGGGGGGGVGPGGWGSGSSAGPASGSSSSMEQGPTGGAWGSFPANKVITMRILYRECNPLPLTARELAIRLLKAPTIIQEILIIM